MALRVLAYSKTNDRVQPLTEVFKYPGKPVAGQIVAHYQDGTWRMVRRAPVPRLLRRFRR